MALYELADANGNTVRVQAPAGATKQELLSLVRNRDRVEADRRVRAGAERFGGALRTQADAMESIARSRKPSFLDRVGEIPKGVISGAANVLESGALGVATLLPEGAENVVRSGIQSAFKPVQDYVAPDFNLEESVPRKFSEAAGSFAGIVGASLVNPLAGAGVAVSAGAGEASERARAAGATQGERNLAALQGILPGALELIPASRLVKGIKQLYKGEAKPVELIVNRIARATREGGIEMGQEVASGIAQNMIEQGYNPEQGTFEGSGEAAGYGGSVGFLAQALLDLATPRARGDAGPLQITDQRAEPLQVEDQREGIAGLLPAPPKQIGQQRTGATIQARADVGKMLDTEGNITLENMQNIVARTGVTLPDLERVASEEIAKRGSALAGRAQEEIEDELTTPDVEIPPSRIATATADAREGRSAVQAAARRRLDQTALEQDDMTGFEQPDLLAAELEQARKERPEAALSDDLRAQEEIDPVTPKTTKPEPKLETDLLDLIQQDEAQDANATVRRARAEAQEKDLAARTAEPLVKTAEEAPFRQAATRRKQIVDDTLAKSTTSSLVNTERSVQKALAAAGMPRTDLTRNEKLAVKKKIAEVAQAQPIRDSDAPTDFALGTANEEQFVFPADVSRAPKRVGDEPPAKIGAANVQSKETQPETSGASVLPVGPDVGAEGQSSDVVDVSNTPEGAKRIKPPRSNRLGSAKLEPRPVDGTKIVKPDPIKTATDQPDSIKRSVMPTFPELTKTTKPKGGVRFVSTKASQPTRKDKVEEQAVDKEVAAKNVRAKLKKRWDDTATDQRKREYKPENNIVKGDPFTPAENRKILKIVETPVKSRDKAEMDAVVTYLGLYPNPAEGIYAAIYDMADGTPQVRGDPLLKGTGGKAAEKMVAWANKNLDNTGKKWLEVTTAKIAADLNKVADANRTVAELKVQGVSDPVQEARDKAAREAELDAKDAAREAKDVENYDVEKQLRFIRTFKKKLLEANAVVGLDLPQHPAVTAAIKDGNLGVALSRLEETSPSQQVRKLAKKLASLVGTTKVVIKKNLKAEDGRPAAGLFDPKTNTVMLDADTGINTHTILHEMVHAAASNTLSNKSHPLTKQLTKLFNDVKDQLGTVYGAKDVDEFLSEAMSNPEFRSTLAKINAKGEPIGALRRFLNSVGNYVRTLMGLETNAITSLDITDKFAEGVLAPAPKYRNSGQLLMMSTPDVAKKAAKMMLDKTQQSLGPEGRKQFKFDSTQFMRTASAKSRRLLIRLTGLQGLAEIAEAAGLQKLGFVLDKIVNDQRGDIRRANEIVKREIDKIITWTNSVSPEMKQTLDRLIYNDKYGATIYQVDPTKARTEYSKFWLKNTVTGKRIAYNDKKARDAEVKRLNFEANKGKDKADKVNIAFRDGNRDETKLEVWDEQRADWNALEKNGGQKAYLDMRNHYRTQYEKMRDVVFGEIDSLMGDKTKEAKKLKNEVYARLFDKTTLDVYFPLVREGTYKLTYAAKNPSSDREALIVRMFTTATERDAAASKIKNNSAFTGVTTEDGELTLATFRQAPSNSFVKQTLDALDANGVDNDVQEQIMRLFIDTLPETSFAKSLQKRQGTPGFIQDSVFAMKSKAYDLAGQTEKLRTSAKLRAFQREVLGRKTPIDAVQGKGITNRAAQSLRAPFEEVQAELLDRAQFASEGAQNKNFEAIGRRLNQTAFIATIGFNASSALVNLSQVPLFVLPFLGAKYGYGAAYTAVKEAGTLVGGSKNSLLNNYDIRDDGVLVVKKDIPPERKKQLEELKPLVSEAMQRGQLGQGYLAEALGLDESGRISRSGRAGTAMDNISVLSAYLFNHGEQFNRQVTLVTSYRLALQAVGKDPKTKNLPSAQREQLAAEQAIRETQETNGGSFLETAPPIAREGYGRVMWMYKSYGLQMYYSMFKAAKIAMDSDKGKLFGKDGSPERKAAVKQLLGLHGTALFFAGIQGIPLYGAVQMMADLFFLDDEEDDFDTIVRKYIGEGWYKGAITEFAGIDVASRTALTGLLLQENRFNNDPSLEENLGHYLGGPAFSVTKRILRGGRDILDGEFSRGIESLLPVAGTNFYKATFGRYAQEGGAFTRRADPIYDDITGGELVAQMLGFPPTEYTFRQEQNQNSKRIDIAVNKKRSKLLKKYYVATRIGDYKAANDVNKDMLAFSKRHPEAAIDGETIDRSMKQHMKTSIEMYNGVTLSSLYRDTLEQGRREYKQ